MGNGKNLLARGRRPGRLGQGALAAPIALLLLCAASEARAADTINKGEKTKDLSSKNSKYRMRAGAIGDLTITSIDLLGPGTLPLPVWTSGTVAPSAKYSALLGDDCRLILRDDTTKEALWASSNAASTGSCFAQLGDDGNLVIKAGSTAAPGATLWTSTRVIRTLAECTKTLIYQPAGTDNPIVFHVAPADGKATATTYEVTNAMVYTDIAGGLTIPLPIIDLEFITKDGANVTSIDGTIGLFPAFPFSGILQGLTTAGGWGPLSFSATSGLAYKAVFDDLPLNDKRNYLLFSQVAEFPNTGMTIGNINLTQEAENKLNEQFQFLVDPTDPAVLVFASMAGMGDLTEVGDIGIGLSAQGLIPFKPTTPGNLPDGAMPEFNGQTYMAGSIPVYEVLTMDGGVTIDIDPDKTGKKLDANSKLKLGVNGGVGLDVPFLGSILGLDLTFGTASAVVVTEKKSFQVAISGQVNTNDMIPTGLPAAIFPQATATVNAYFNSKDYTAAYLEAEGQYKVATSSLPALNPGLPEFNDMPPMFGKLRADKTGVQVSATFANVTLLSSPSLVSTGSFSSSFDVDGSTFSMDIDGSLVAMGVPLAEVALSVTNKKASLTGAYHTKYADVMVSGDVRKNQMRLMGDADLTIPVEFKAGKSAQEVVDSTVCSAQKVANGVQCGFDTVEDAAKCGTKHYNDALHCGADVLTNGAKCGYAWVKNIDKCGADVFHDAFHCGVSCVSSLFKDCTCKFAKSCNTPKTCQIPKSCSVANSCLSAKSCDAANKCTWEVDLPSGALGTVKGRLHIEIDTSRGVSGSGSFQWCTTGGSCSSIGTGRMTFDVSKPTLCIPKVPALGNKTLCIPML